MKVRKSIYLVLAILSMLLYGGCNGSPHERQGTVATLEDFNGTVREDASAGDVAGNIEISNTDGSMIFAIILSGTGNDNFEVSTDGVIRVNEEASLDYEVTTVYQLTAVAINAKGMSAPVNVTINIADVEEMPPVLEDSSATVWEGAGAGTLVGRITIIDQGYTPVTMMTLDGNDSENFEVNSSGYISVSNSANLDENGTVYAFNATATNTIGASHQVTVTIEVVGENEPYIAGQLGHVLFAHGLNSTAGVWSNYTKYAESKDWSVYKTSVSPQGSIETRAGELVDYINTLELEDHCLVAVGHSMGGVDLHYIVSQGHLDGSGKFYDAAKKIKKIYTIASPHKGNPYGGLPELSEYFSGDAGEELGVVQMREFNQEYPYSTFEIDGYKIPLLALRFMCPGSEYIPVFGYVENDGVVPLNYQTLNGAPHSLEKYPAIHMNTENNFCTKLPMYPPAQLEEEVAQELLTLVLHDLPYEFIESDVHDIVFYEGNECTQEERGVFSSRTVSRDVLNCQEHPILPDLSGLPDGTSEEDIADIIGELTTHIHRADKVNNCYDDEIRSVKIFPGVKKNTAITLFNSKNGVKSDDWTRIHIGNVTLNEPYCINTLDASASSLNPTAYIDAKSKNITVDVHRIEDPIGGLDGKVSSLQINDSENAYDVKNHLVYYEGLGCTEGIKGVFDTRKDGGTQCLGWDDMINNVIDDPFGNPATNILYNCSNDEIKSLRIYPGVEKNVVLKLYNDPDGQKNDDWTRVHIGDTTLNEPFCVNGFEHFTSSRESDINISTSKHASDEIEIDPGLLNGLNGKVSYIYTGYTSQSSDPDNIIFYEGYECKEEIKGAFKSAQRYEEECQNDGTPCANDEIKSVMLYPGIDADTTIKLYDDPNSSENDDWIRIHVGTVLDKPFCITNLEHQTTSEEAAEDITVQYTYVSGTEGYALDGKVSFVRIFNSVNETDPTDSIVFYEGNSCTQNVKGSFDGRESYDIDCYTPVDPTIPADISKNCINDEIRSVLIYPSVPANTLIKLYNNADDSLRDDWTRVHIGDHQLQEPFCITGFEHQTSDREKAQNISVSYHYSNSGVGDGLNGKISRIKIAPESSKTDPDDIVFYEGNYCEQEIKGVMRSHDKKEVNCQESGSCDNDEIRSVLLYPGIDKNMLIKLYNSPVASKSVDWTRVHIGDTTLTEPFCINGFEHQAADSSRERAENITMNFHYDGTSGLNGKISHIKLLDSSNPNDPDNIVFYEGNGCTENIKGVYKSGDSLSTKCYTPSTITDYDVSSDCINDEISSVLIYPGIDKNTLIKVYNHPDKSKFDDWTRIHIGDTTLIEPFCITGLEHQTSDRERAKNITSTHHVDNEGIGDGLNGKISHVQIGVSTSANDPDDIVYYADLDCSEGISGVFQSQNNTYVSCKESDRCKDDEIKSVLLYPDMKKYKAMRLYEDEDGSIDKDYTSIYRGAEDIDEPFCIRGLEHDTSDREAAQGITVNYHKKGVTENLNGKVSSIKIVPSSDM